MELLESMNACNHLNMDKVWVGMEISFVKDLNWYLCCFTSAYFTRPRVVLFEQQFCVSPVACGMVFMLVQKGSNSLSIDRLSQHLDILS